MQDAERTKVMKYSIWWIFFSENGNISLAEKQTMSVRYLQGARQRVFDIQSCTSGRLRHFMKSNVIGISQDDDDEVLICTSTAVVVWKWVCLSGELCKENVQKLL